MKTCTVCKISKPLDQFYRWKRSGDGRTAACKQCTRNRLASKGSCVDCGGRVSHKRAQRCQKCRADQQRTGGRTVKDGYVIIAGMQAHPNAHHGKIGEHILIMSEYLGRPLIKGETVHHKNGVRDDNRLSNLELWSKAQPAGQRVIDKLEYAREIIALYEGYEDPSD